MKRIIISAITIVISLNAAICQNLAQTVRGTIKDSDNDMPLIGATVVIDGTKSIIGTATDLDGNFSLENIPVGRITLQLSYLGYESKSIPNIVVSTGKEVVLTLDMTESTVKIDEVVITPEVQKDEALNEMSIISARTISVEETNRYAGSINDPARMVSSYAGVTNNPLGNNEIIVRGNSPQGILWRLEGIEIPNPNHFSKVGGTGGPISALNSNMLANSDFYTGAFSPEYGNATSGVFDMKLRKGNNMKSEQSFGASVLGTDITVEGPFSKNYSGSYLANYRYSTLGLLCDMGVVEYGGIPRYQDASFNISLPTSSIGIFSIFGLGGLSGIYDETKSEEDVVLEKSDTKCKLGIVGLNHSYIFSEKTYLKSSVSVSGNSSDNYWKVRDNNDTFYTAEEGTISDVNTRFATTLNNKINAKNRINTGLIYTIYSFDYTYNAINSETTEMLNVVNENGSSGLFQAFTSWKHRFNEKLSFTTGIHYTQLLLNNNFSVDPRVALKWEFKPNQSLTIGFGQHSKTESLSTYFAYGLNENSERVRINENLELTKARHYVLGYDNMLKENLYFKTELYYQQLYNVPVANDINSTFSVLNQMDGIPETALVNKGAGTNYGIEMSLEKFLSNDYYFLITTSVYESTYIALDGIERPTVWNGNYVFNVLGGKEFKFGNPDKGRVAFFNTKIAYVGGGLYRAIDIEQSHQQNRSVLGQFYSDSEDFFKADLTIGIRRNRKNATHELKIEVQNVTNNASVVRDIYDPVNGKTAYLKQLPMVPIVSYKIDF